MENKVLKQMNEERKEGNGYDIYRIKGTKTKKKKKQITKSNQKQTIAK